MQDCPDCQYLLDKMDQTRRLRREDDRDARSLIKENDTLLKALAECRDAFGSIPPEDESFGLEAIGDPLAVADYVKGMVKKLEAELATAEKENCERCRVQTARKCAEIAETAHERINWDTEGETWLAGFEQAEDDIAAEIRKSF